VRERDRHDTYFAEGALATTRGAATWVAGAALQHEGYANDDVARFDYGYTIPEQYTQVEIAAAPWLALSASGRLDQHSAYGTLVNPRLSVLVRAPNAWTARLSAGTGAFAPTPFTETTEATGLTPLDALGDLVPERATSASLDVGGALGPLELNATAFGSRIRHALLVRASAAGDAMRLVLANATQPTRTGGADVLVRWHAGATTTTASYTYVRSTEQAPTLDVRRRVPLTPGHAAGLASVWEQEGRGRVGLEVYYTGRQPLEDDPYRATGRPYVVFGAIAERRFGRWRPFVNFENLGDVRMTRWEPLVRPFRGLGGRWTTDAWGPLEGRVVNGGVRIDLGRGSGDGPGSG
jgi:iron complex outermembrane receptor protein